MSLERAYLTKYRPSWVRDFADEQDWKNFFDRLEAGYSREEARELLAQAVYSRLLPILSIGYDLGLMRSNEVEVSKE